MSTEINGFIIGGSGTGNVTGPVSSVTGNIPSFSDTTGKVLSDSGVLASSVVVGPASVTAGALAAFSGTSGKLLFNTGITFESSQANYLFSGPWATTLGATIEFSRIGSLVTLYMKTIVTENASISSIIYSNALPIRFAPAVTIYLPALVVDNGLTSACSMFLTTTGILSFTTAAQGPFSGLSTVGPTAISPFCISYLTS